MRCSEIIGEYSAAACARSGAFLEQVITTSVQMTVWYLDYVHCISAYTDVYTVYFGEAKENNMG